MERRTEMYGHIERQQHGKLSIKDYCHEHGIVPSTFHYWRKKMRMEGVGSFKALKIDGTHDFGVSIFFPNGIELGVSSLSGELIEKLWRCS